MTTSRERFSAPILSSDGKIPFASLAYFRARLRMKLHQFLLKEFAHSGLTRAAMARRLDCEPSQITRWLAAPSNVRLDTLSDLLACMGGEPEFEMSHFEPAQQSTTTDAVPLRLGTKSPIKVRFSSSGVPSDDKKAHAL